MLLTIMSEALADPLVRIMYWKVFAGSRERAGITIISASEYANRMRGICCSGS